MRIIGLIGPKGSGKDTSYELLRDQKRVDGKISFAGPLKQICGQVFGLHHVYLNDAVLKEKELEQPITLTLKHIRKIIELCEEYVPSVTSDGLILYRSNAVSTTGLEGRVFKTPRELLQIIGTELIRERIYKGWHLSAAFSPKVLNSTKEDKDGRKRRVYKQDGTYAVTDVRFENEHDFLAERFGKAYKAFYVKRPEAEEVLATATHPSELETQKIRAKLEDSVIDNSGTLEDLGKLLGSLDLKAEVTEVPEKGSRFRYTPAQETDG